jgi:hypothetical protein
MTTDSSWMRHYNKSRKWGKPSWLIFVRIA